MSQLQIDNLKAIFDNEDSVSWDGDNALEGLNIIARYFPCKTVLQAADHDIIYSVDAQEVLDAGLSVQDAQRLAHLNWMIDSDSDCLACYV